MTSILKTVIHTCILFFCPVILFAQYNAEALYSTITNRRLPDSIRIEAADALQSHYVYAAPDSLLLFERFISNMEGERMNADWQATRHIALGRYFIIQGELDTAFSNYTAAYNLIPKIKSELLTAVIYSVMGYIKFVYSGDDQSALKDFQKSEKIFISQKD